MALGSLRNHHPVGKDGRMPLQRQWYFDCSPRPVPHRLHCFAYSAFAGFRIGMSVSASFQSAEEILALRRNLGATK
jgi:hypothetical protein